MQDARGEEIQQNPTRLNPTSRTVEVIAGVVRRFESWSTLPASVPGYMGVYTDGFRDTPVLGAQLESRAGFVPEENAHDLGFRAV